VASVARGRRAAVAAAALVLTLAGAAPAIALLADAKAEHVARVVDGDSVDLTGGARVRLVQIDAPELGVGECYSLAAANALRRLLPRGVAVGLEADPQLEQVDKHGRLLRYAWRGRTNLNIELVREGAATVWLFRGERGRYAERLLAAARKARTENKGMWGACLTVWNPYGPATTHPRKKQ
jgi:micrococcal nuclease